MSKITEITNVEQNNAIISNNDRCIIFFGSNKCEYCKKITPEIILLSKQYPKIKFAHAEVNKLTLEN